MFVVIFMLAIGLRLICFEGYADANPRTYAILANDLSMGELHIPDPEITPVFPVRIGAYAPSALLIGLFGLSNVTMVAFVLLIDLLSLCLVYVVCRTVFGGLAGLIGLTLLAISPLDVSMASRFLPHTVAAFWGNLGMCLVWAAIAMQIATRRRWLLALLAGLAFGGSWMTYESVAYLVPPVVLILLFSGRERSLQERLWITMMIGVGSIIVLAGEMTFHWYRTGDLLYRLNATERNYEVCSEFFFVQSSTRFGWEEGGFTRIMIDRLFVSGPTQLIFGRALGGITLLGLVAILWAFVTKKRRFMIPGIWLISLLLLFNFMTTSFESYKPLPIIQYLSRYLSPMIFPSVVLGAGLISDLLLSSGSPSTHKRRSRARMGGVILLTLACVASLPGLGFFITSGRVRMEEKVLSMMPEDALLFTDMRSAGNIIFIREGILESRSDTTIPFEDIDPSTLPPGSYVLLNEQMKQLLMDAFQYTPPAIFDDAHPDWTLIWEKPGVRFYQVGQPNLGRIGLSRSHHRCLFEDRRQEATGMARFVLGDVLGCSRRDKSAAFRTTLGSQVDDPVGALDHIEVVLDDDERAVVVRKPLHDAEQELDVRKVQTGRRLVQDVERVALGRGSQLGGEFDSLCLASRQRR
jgi:hypothetical protein